jgi:hypothetical protein
VAPRVAGSNPVAHPKLFKHLVRFHLPTGCTVVAQRFQQFHGLERAFWHVFDVMAFCGAHTRMAQEAFRCQRIREVRNRRPDSASQGVSAMPFRKGFIQSEIVVCLPVFGFRLLTHDTSFQSRNHNAIGKVVQG